MARTIFNRFGVPPQTRAASSASAAPGRRVVSPAAHGFLFSMPVVDDPYYHVYIHIHLEGV